MNKNKKNKIMKQTTSKINDVLRVILLKLNIDIIYLEKIEKYLNILLNKNMEINLISRKLTLNEIIFELLAYYWCLRDIAALNPIMNGGICNESTSSSFQFLNACFARSLSCNGSRTAVLYPIAQRRTICDKR